MSRKIKIRYKAFRNKKTGKFVSNKYALRHPKSVFECTISYTLKK